MKVIQVKDLVTVGDFQNDPQYRKIESDIFAAIQSIKNPSGCDGFYLRNEKKSNGVKPIKNAFVNTLDELGWKNEWICDPIIKSRRFDSSIKLNNGKYFCTEWETGNISSSHRALNRIALAIKENVIEGGFLVLPSRRMYELLTDRVGNYSEIENYFSVWEDLKYAYTIRAQRAVIKVIEIEHDGIRDDIKPLPKGTDGRALV
jgi:hypothetical protein